MVEFPLILDIETYDYDTAKSSSVRKAKILFVLDGNREGLREAIALFLLTLLFSNLFFSIL